MKTKIKGFIEFIREQGVVGFGIGFILATSITKMVTSFVNDIISPSIGIVFGNIQELKGFYLQIGQNKIMWGNFLSTVIDFLILSAVVYFAVKSLNLTQIDIKKDTKK